MARPSKIDKLPPELREEIGRLRQRGKSIDEILRKLRELDPEADVSRSGLHRHVQRIDRIGEELRRSRAVAEGIARALGDKPADELTRASIELLHQGVFELLSDAAAAEDEEGEAARALVRNPKASALLAETIERLVKSSRGNLEFVTSIEKRAKAEAAASAETAAKEAGLSGAMIDTIKRRILGLKG